MEIINDSDIQIKNNYFLLNKGEIGGGIYINFLNRCDNCNLNNNTFENNDMLIDAGALNLINVKDI